MAKSADPHHINARLQKQMARLLDQLEDADNRAEITIPQRINSLIALGRLQIMFMGLRREDSEPDNVGATVTKYSRTFQDKADGARRGKANPRSRAVIAFDADDDHDDTD